MKQNSMNKNLIKITGWKKITDLPQLNLFSIQFRDKNGAEKSWQVASRCSTPKYVDQAFETPDAVIIVPYHIAHRKLIIIEEFRVPIGGYQYGFPAGLLDPGETIEAAAWRELHEETGLTLEAVRRVSPPVYSSSGMTDESITLVYAECSGRPNSDANESVEDITAHMVSQAEAGALCMRTDLKFDVKTWVVLSGFAGFGWPGIIAKHC